ncbi:hypothetical protein CW354_06415 [Marinicaulis flavus]|uniref:Uncharacterized protein n=1 Tax=Hyphococcus luteus TaxID=2058213 RepID=A0A2S7K645_9PROT|nr:hypothetical protein CW354_06415 [Marinicaulis flavus]
MTEQSPRADIDKKPKRPILAFLVIMAFSWGAAEVSTRFFGTRGSFVALTVILFIWVLFFVAYYFWTQRRNRSDQNQ